MTTINGAGSSAGSAWSAMQAARDARRAWMEKEMFADTDSDGSGGVDGTELQTVLDKMASATGGNAAKATDLVSQFGTDGTLNQDQLAQAMQSLVPPRSTMEFAQSRGSETPDTGGSPQGPARAEDAASTSASSSTSTTDTTDPLQALFQAVDSDGDGRIGREEAAVLSQTISDVLSSLGTDGTSPSDGSASNGSGSFDLSQLAQLVLKQYEQVGSASSSRSTGTTLSAVA